MSRLDFAIEVASQYHSDQTRRGTMLPYVVHPIRVMARLTRAGVASEHILCAAVLHDTVEDTDLTDADISQMFGTEVADLVADLTFDPGFYASKRDYMASFRDKSIESCIIKMSDRIDNLIDAPSNLTKCASEALELADACAHDVLGHYLEVPYTKIRHQLLSAAHTALAE